RIAPGLGSRDHKWGRVGGGPGFRDGGDRGDLLGPCRTPKGGIWRWMHNPPPCLGISRWRVMCLNGAETVALAEIEGSELCPADAHRIAQYRGEHWLKLTGRSTDDLQHFRGRRPLLQRLRKVPPRLGQLTGARFELLFQLDR